MWTRVSLGISALALVFAALPAESRDEGWTVYSDSVHGCRLDYPESLFKRDPFDVMENIQRFSGATADTYFRVMGADNEAGLSPSEVKAKYLKADIPGDVSYERTTGRFLVLSGFRGETIFYTRVAVSPDGRAVCILEVTYPRSKKRDFDGIVTRMSRSFGAG